MFAHALLTAVLAAGQSGPLAVIPFKLGEHAIIVEAVVNNKTVSCMFDTGFSGSFVIGPHIDLGKPTGKMNLVDFVGAFEVDTLKVTSLALGDLRAKHEGMEVVQLPTMDYTLNYGTHVDGIMGLEVFAPYVVEINFETQAFVVHPPSHDITTVKPDGAKTFLAKMLPIGHTSVEMAVKTKQGKQMILALDTGNAFYATTHKDVLERVGLWQKGREPKYVGASQVASGVVESWSILMEDAQIFGVPVGRAVWDIIDLPSSTAQHDGTVGFGFLKHFNVTIDLTRRRVLLVNFSGRFVDEPEGVVGFAAAYHPGKGRMVVFSVTPDGPADRAGVKEDDFLVSIGDENLTKTSYRHVKSLLSGKVGTEIDVAVSSGGQLRRMKLKRELLVNAIG